MKIPFPKRLIKRYTQYIPILFCSKYTMFLGQKGMEMSNHGIMFSAVFCFPFADRKYSLRYKI